MLRLMTEPTVAGEIVRPSMIAHRIGGPAILASGFQPNNPLEPAVIATLAPGAYTAIVSGAGGTTGVGLVGVFKAP